MAWHPDGSIWNGGAGAVSLLGPVWAADARTIERTAQGDASL